MLAPLLDIPVIVVMRTRAREDQGVVGKLARVCFQPEITIGKIYTNFAKQSSSELNGSSLSSAKR
ncbi:MAG: hypothetical protein WBX95_21650 [Xanthobacteraceae bacterium]